MKRITKHEIDVEGRFFRVYKFGQIHKAKSYYGQLIPVGSENLSKELVLLRVECRTHIDKSIKEDIGTCVIGAGIKINVFRTGRHKHPFEYHLVDAPFQGNVSTWRALKPILKFLNKKFPQLNATYFDGWMD